MLRPPGSTAATIKFIALTQQYHVLGSKMYCIEPVTSPMHKKLLVNDVLKATKKDKKKPFYDNISFFSITGGASGLLCTKSSPEVSLI